MFARYLKIAKSFAEMKDDVLKELLLKSRYPVGVKEWEYGGDIRRVSSDSFPLPIDAPVVGWSKSEEKCFNSDGRSALMEECGYAFKIKGVDPYGHIMASYWLQKTKDYENDKKEFLNQIKADDALWTAYLYHEGKYTLLKDGNLGRHGKNPFGVLLERNAQNESDALKLIASGYEKRGYIPPQTPAAICEFESLDFVSEGNSQKTASVLTKLPLSIGSDLRLSELNTLIIKEYASIGEAEKRSKERAIRKFYEKAHRWVGYDARILFENSLLPMPESSVSSNFAVNYKKADKEIGISRVDHTSTKIGAEKSKAAKKSLFWNSSKIVDCQNPLLLKENNRIIFAVKKLGALRNYKRNFEEGWNGKVEPLNDYIEAVVA